MNPTQTLRTATVVAAAGLALATAACGSSTSSPEPTSGSGDVIPAAWYATVAEQFEKAGDPSSTPTIDLDADCAFDATVRIAGKGPRGFGAGASSVGETGRRYQCNFTDPSSYLIVGTFTEDADFVDVADSLMAVMQAGNEQTEETFTVAGRSIRVVKTVYPTNSTHIDYAASVVDPANKAYALFTVETTRDLKSTYTSRQAAEDFTAVLKR